MLRGAAPMPRPLLTFTTLALLAVGPLAGARPAAAEDAETLIQKGIELRRRGRDADAEGFFRRAYETSPTPRAAAQLGLVLFQLSRWPDAEKHLEEALDAKRDPWIARNRPTLESSLETVRKHVGELEITGEPAGAEAFVNGTPVGRLPLRGRVRVAEGPVEIELRAPGYAPGRRALTVRPGKTERVELALTRPEAAAPAPPAPAPTPTPAGPPPAPPIVIEATPRPAPSAGGRPSLRVAGLVTGGIGLAALGVGGYYSYRVSQIEKDQAGIKPGEPDAEARLAAFEADGRSASQRQWVAYGVGAAGVTAGALLYFFGRGEPGADRAAVAPVVGPGRAGLAMALSF
jgi:tetratricopeptide (TPR) repeat protein